MPADTWTSPDLSGRIAVVTGATRGVGRGIAEVLGSCGATVYVVGRSTRAKRSHTLGSTIEDVAATVTANGGRGIPARCDVGKETQVARLFSRVERKHGRIDVLVSNAVGWELAGDAGDAEDPTGLPIHRKPVAWWDGNFGVGVRSHFMACRYGIGLMREHGGLVVFTSEYPDDSVERKDVVLDLRAHATARMAKVLARQVRSKQIAMIVLVPGFPRTEIIQSSWDRKSPYFSGWTQDEYLAKTETVHFSGRAVAALATAPDMMQRSGSVMRVFGCARAYGFTDTDGRVALSLYEE
jgi:NAD(P)-dependent dehydrogenase (short-subunit alcohol dehydrogenase family)